jgi:hypothetical protein
MGSPLSGSRRFPEPPEQGFDLLLPFAEAVGVWSVVDVVPIALRGHKAGVTKDLEML